MCLQCTLALAAWLLDASKPLCAVSLRSPCRLSVEMRYPDCVGLGNTLRLPLSCAFWTEYIAGCVHSPWGSGFECGVVGAPELGAEWCCCRLGKCPLILAVMFAQGRWVWVSLCVSLYLGGGEGTGVVWWGAVVSVRSYG